MTSVTTAAAAVVVGGKRTDVTLKLSQLQNLAKRDPVAYREDYEAQIRRLESELGILALQSSTGTGSAKEGVVELMQFAAAVSSSSYKGVESDRIAQLLIGLLVGNTASNSNKDTWNNDEFLLSPTSSSAVPLHKEIRKTAVSALILMRNKGCLEPLLLLRLFFRLLATVPEKAMRELLYKHMVQDIRNLNKKGKQDQKVNRAVQSFLHKVVSAHAVRPGGSHTTTTVTDATEESVTDMAAKRATDLVCELYRRQVWTDDRTVAILASAAESRNTTVMARALRFFLGIEEQMAADQRDYQEKEWQEKSRIDFHSHSKKTAKRERQTERQLANRKRMQLKKEGSDWMDSSIDNDRGVEAAKKLYPAIELLRDPQGLAEAVFRRLRTAGSVKYELKLLMINFVTRLVGNHQLLLLPLYPFLQKYMGGQQRDVTAILAYTVQACHEHVPPEEVYGILKTIAHNFITERCSEEQMAVGINAARAICARVPSALFVDKTESSSSSLYSTSIVMDMEAFCRDLAAYANHRDRSVSIAGKAWTNFVRETHPSLLQGKKQRGQKGSALHKAGVQPLQYGQFKAASGVEGADLLVEYEAKKAAAAQKKQKKPNDDDDAGDDDDEDDELEVPVEEDGDDASDASAPDLVLLEDDDKKKEEEKTEQVIDLSKMTQEERDLLKQQVSSTRIFSAADFKKMRKLVEREQRAKRDPREAARQKRALARGEEFQPLSDEDSDEENDSEDDDELHITGAVNPMEIMADAKKKRQNKAERLGKIIAGRSQFESKSRDGGATNEEKKRTKNFQMSKHSSEARRKGRGKGGLSKRKPKEQMFHEAKKRRRKL